MALDKEVLESAEFKAAVSDALKAEHAGLITNRAEALADKAKARKALEAYGDITPEEAKTLAAAKKKAEDEAARKAGDFDTLKATLEKEHAAQIEQLAGERDSYKVSLEHEMIEKAAIEAITGAKGKPKLLKREVLSKMKLIKAEDGKRKAVIVDDNGQPLLRKEAKNAGDYMPVREFVESLRDDDEFAFAFDGSGASGGATPDRVVHGDDSGSLNKKLDEGVKFI